MNSGTMEAASPPLSIFDLVRGRAYRLTGGGTSLILYYRTCEHGKYTFSVGRATRLYLFERNDDSGFLCDENGECYTVSEIDL